MLLVMVTSVLPVTGKDEHHCERLNLYPCFSEFDFYDLYKSTFENSELGRMKKLLPLHAMAENFGLARKSMRTKLGRKSYVRPIVRGK